VQEEEEEDGGFSLRKKKEMGNNELSCAVCIMFSAMLARLLACLPG
jgi:hypothetical protein